MEARVVREKMMMRTKKKKSRVYSSPFDCPANEQRFEV
jgi:hypothetical protein